jgi:hydrogenase expression/formation protein HypC
MCLGVPARVVEKTTNYSARVDVNGNHTEINIQLTPDVEPGQFVLVHAGFLP